MRTRSVDARVGEKTFATEHADAEDLSSGTMRSREDGARTPNVQLKATAGPSTAVATATFAQDDRKQNPHVRAGKRREHEERRVF